MKKFLGLIALVLAFPAFGQVIDSSQAKLKTNGGLAGDTANALAVAVYRGTSAPGTPVAGQLWLDTNTTPPILKEYTGSVWNIPLTPASVTTQADTSSFPGSPTDGQIIFSASPPSLWVYSSTLGAWSTFAMPLVTSAANIRDVYTAAVIATVGAPTVATSGTAGSTGAGAYNYRITCRNSTGGETTGGTTSANVTPGGSKSVDLSAIPTCGTGGTNRNIYRCLSGVTGGPWYFVGNLADNTTTTYHDGAADGGLLAPDINFSAALPGSWTTINNSSNTTTGGCGGTGATRGTMACYAGVTGLAGNSGSFTTDSIVVRGSLSIASYTSGNYTMQYRVKQVSQNGDSYLSVNSPTVLGMRIGTGDAAIRFFIATGGSAGGSCNIGEFFTLPYSGSSHPYIVYWPRNVTATDSGACAFTQNPYPEIDAVPFWLRVVRRGGTINVYTSPDGTSWSPTTQCSGSTNVTTAVCSINSAVMGGTSLDHVELPMASADYRGQGSKGWLEIDSFTLTVN